ncbi:hypothetical protein [Streptomyces sp. CA-251251]|uniref:hypothetical protein n=1 Tax=Streptomyces sp. CA-251251 TaxID=3240063 RepID=UPI003D8D7F1E
MPPLSALSSRSPDVRDAALTAAAGALTTAVAVTPAVAREEWGGSGTDGASAEPSVGDGGGSIDTVGPAPRWC